MYHRALLSIRVRQVKLDDFKSKQNRLIQLICILYFKMWHWFEMLDTRRTV